MFSSVIVALAHIILLVAYAYVTQTIGAKVGKSFVSRKTFFHFLQTFLTFTPRKSAIYASRVSKMRC